MILHATLERLVNNWSRRSRVHWETRVEGMFRRLGTVEFGPSARFDWGPFGKPGATLG